MYETEKQILILTIFLYIMYIIFIGVSIFIMKDVCRAVLDGYIILPVFAYGWLTYLWVVTVCPEPMEV